MYQNGQTNFKNLAANAKSKFKAFSGKCALSVHHKTRGFCFQGVKKGHTDLKGNENTLKNSYV